MKYKKGLVSAIMPTYNRSEWVIERVEELLQQEYENWELVIVDDASTDDTQEVCETFSKRHDNISYIRLEENSGSVTIPRNVGIVNCAGEFIAPTDDDVMVLPHKFRLLVDALNNSTDNLAYGNKIDYYMFDSPNYQQMLEGQQLNVVLKMGGEHNVPNGRFDPIRDWNPMEKWGVDGGQFIYRKSVYDEMDLLFVRRGCDWELAKKLWAIKEGFTYIDEVVSIYKWHNDNRSVSQDTITKETPIYPGKYSHHFEGLSIEQEV